MNHMPIVEPIPIPTKGKPFFHRVIAAFKPRKWRLVKDYIREIPLNKRMRTRALIPAPFVFDFASVPRIFWVFLDPVGLLLVGSAFHDFGYRYGGLFFAKKGSKNKWVFVPYGKTELDIIFERITEDVNDMKIMACIARIAVGIGGYFAWRKQRKMYNSVFEDYPRLKG